MMTKIRDVMARREASEKGFTLVELLVVIIIIGILAAVAIPIFLNQQKSAVDSATTSDVRNVATNIETLRVQVPNETNWTWVQISTAPGETRGRLHATAPVAGHPQQVIPLSDGTEIIVLGGSTLDDGVTILGWNKNGNQDGGTTGRPTSIAEINAATTEDYVIYKSTEGGLQ